jgi:hypothetical protein
LTIETQQEGIPPRLERYELKFTIPFSQIEPISQFTATYCSRDRYSAAAESGFYRVHNLYLDTPGFLFLRNRRHRAPNRFNMRVRSYGDEPALPYYLEVKQRIGGVIRKYRAPVRNPDWNRVFSEPGFCAPEQSDSPSQAKNRELFERLSYTYQVEPKVLTQYVRKAWISDIDDYARVTFDIDLRFVERSAWNPVPEEGEDSMQHYDLPAVFDPGCSVILELKCLASFVPLWMVDLIRTFSLKRRSFSKYMFSMNELIALRGYDPAQRVAQLSQLRY